MKHYYAKTEPRGFANEFTVIAFDSVDARDAYVANTDHTWALTRKEASAAIRYRGDACTTDYSDSLNCYFGSGKNFETSLYSATTWQARQNISKAIEDGSMPLGASTTPVAL